MQNIVQIMRRTSGSGLLRLQQRTRTTWSHNDTYQYYAKSKVPSLHFQQSLPRLPIPKLEQTCARYLRALEPILSAHAHQEVRKICEHFQTNTGPRLHAYLLEYDKNNRHTSYINEMWTDMYLTDRKPLPINYNPFITHVDFSDKAYNAQPIKATNLVISALRFMNSLRAHTLKPEVFHLNPKVAKSTWFDTYCALLPQSIAWYGAFPFKAYALDMSQYDYLYNTTRIPCVGKDAISQDTTGKHIVVMRNGNMFAVNVLDDNGKILAPEVIYGRLLAIIEDSCAPAKNPLGALTSMNRDRWANARVALEVDNSREIRSIDTALFVLCLDDDSVDDDKVKLVRSFLHADATNRWFDKSLSLIVSRDGKSGVNFEHAWGDGVAVMRFMTDIYNDANENPFVHPTTEKIQEANPVKRLEFKLNDALKEQISSAVSSYRDLTQNLDVNYILSPKINRKVCKKNNVSPDSIMQLIFQLAYFKQNRKYVATYESCSTAAFKHGRTETIRPCTLATKKFCDELVNEKASPSKLKGLLQNCSTVHSKLTTEAAMGQGFDRHLFALKVMGLRHKEQLSDLYQHSSYATMNYNILSTSTLSSTIIEAGGFGPVVPDGYGTSYVIRNHEIGILVTNYKDKLNGPDFLDCVTSSVDEIVNVMNS